MDKPKLIILNGFAGSGKSTIAKKYISEHPLALLIEGDEIIVNIGAWLKHEADARQHVFELTKSMASTHLSRGYDVVLPYLVTDSKHIDAFQKIANEHDAEFYNLLLFNERVEAIRRLMERGSWGEAGLDPLSDKDFPEITQLYDKMESQLELQPNIIKIDQNGRNADSSYELVVRHINGITSKVE